MSILFEKSEAWRWLVRRTKESKPFFLAFATICGVVPGVIGYGVMQVTNTRNPELEARLRQNARPETVVPTYIIPRQKQKPQPESIATLESLIPHFGKLHNLDIL
ncbi:hypothetical protein FH972_017755 [Carpinus fangiana]|uniref:Uncharacterized protein n=1 Tax=Carpinus fangiana TaxID=176857 RepID=A0A5N6RJU2_9ROSI|nr:hypothetical protein FH972_017755 [Carpinus fangiana]